MATLGLVLGLSYVVSVTPGVYGAYRTADPAGIAPGTWLIVLAAGPLWGFYGWFYADTPVMIYAVTATTAASLILIRYATTRPGSRITSPATAPMEAGE